MNTVLVAGLIVVWYLVTRSIDQKEHFLFWKTPENAIHDNVHVTRRQIPTEFKQNELPLERQLYVPGSTEYYKNV